MKKRRVIAETDIYNGEEEGGSGEAGVIVDGTRGSNSRPIPVVHCVHPAVPALDAATAPCCATAATAPVLLLLLLRLLRLRWLLL